MSPYEESAIEYRSIIEKDVPGIMALCRMEGYKSYYESQETCWSAFNAPGVVTLVAIDKTDVIGFAQFLTDGVLRSYLSMIVVAKQYRKLGIGRKLIEKGTKLCGAKRLDVLSVPESTGFYKSIPGKEWVAFSLYPNVRSLGKV